MHPSVPLVIMLLGTGVSAYVIPNAEYIDNWKAPKFFNADSLLFIVLCVIGFVLSGVAVHIALGFAKPGPERRIEKDPQIPWPVLWFLFYACFVLTTLAYMIWLVSSMAHGLSLADIMAAAHSEQGAVYIIRDKTETVPGVTTFTQAEMAMGILGTLLGFRFGWRKNLLWVVAPMAFVFLLIFLRAHFREERIAIIEYVLPIVILAVALAKTSLWRPSRRLILGLLPLAAPLALYCFFSLAEYSRSWVNFYSGGDMNFFWFTFTRLAGYYVTALNNGAAYMQTVDYHNAYTLPFYSLEFFWKFPLIKDIFPYAELAGVDHRSDYDELLKQQLNPELNNTSGVFVVAVDYGYVGGILFWCLMGVVAVVLYRLFIKGMLPGLLGYPFFYIGLLESPRVLYWSDGRTLVTWGMLVLVSLLGLLCSQGDWRKPAAPQSSSGSDPLGVGFDARRYSHRRGLDRFRYPAHRGL
jgi:hypothetical protein